jgi:hypothetical protein
MPTSLSILFKAYILYLLFTLPALLIPPMYLISAAYALFFCWFAYFLFAIAYFFLYSYRIHYTTRIIGLLLAVVAGVAFAFQMIEVFGVWENVWQSGSFLLFPIAAVLAGWTSIFLAWNKLTASESAVTHDNQIIN